MTFPDTTRLGLAYLHTLGWCQRGQWGGIYDRHGVSGSEKAPVLRGNGPAGESSHEGNRVCGFGRMVMVEGDVDVQPLGMTGPYDSYVQMG